jgi:hypothetical protein
MVARIIECSVRCVDGKALARRASDQNIQFTLAKA